ncbi:MAG TPA: ABC transporter substrate-binding protein [Desulfosporosinus sp.]|nr:ABC transporter substrate-binding protein [Desulfosporosinus sp.]
MNSKIAAYGVIMTLLFSLVGCGQSGTEPTTPQSQKVVVVSWGGSYQAAQKTAMFDPFIKDTGIALTEDSPIDMGKLKSMVESKDVQWDVADVESKDIPRLVSEGILEPIDYTVVNKTDLLESAATEYGVGIDYYSTVMAYNKNTLPAGLTPNNWADFFDINKFPGKRAVRKNPIMIMEIALLADGVDPKSLYPLDIDRAFKKLDTIKNEIVWYDQNAQPVQLLSDKEVVMASVSNGRILDAQKQGQPLDYTYQDGLLDSEAWVIPKGTKNRDAALKFINYASQAKPQADLLNTIPYGPTNTKVFELMDPQYAKTLPTYPENLNKQVLLNGQWWNDDGNYDKINDRFQAWLIKK